MDRLRFRSLASGSSGNCYFLGTASYGILIDAGIGIRTIRHFLRTMGLDFSNIWGLFITHDHADHIRAAGVIGEKHKVPVYTTKLIHNGINKSYCVTQKLSTSQKFIEINEIVDIGDFRIKAFPVSHDATENVGYNIEFKGKSFTFATDLGYVSLEAAEQLVNSDFMVLEANYDDFMLENGPYPLHLQRRIKADTGHLSNLQTARFLTENFTDRWKYVFLCHLSRENNLPELAYSTIVESLRNEEIDFEDKLQIVPLDRINPSPMYLFD
ncbi:MAG TPA: MBL fold metallo-hydrolase [Paludibacteraceae bacterium]|nr:MBL fold metallo-hydrolase [Paludibacteraceae bacterium]HPT43823.1 MBL fold metallo-hydrolase [Paludibacteraceae bacterium]